MSPADRDESTRVPVVRIYRLGEEPGDDLSTVTTPEQRLDILAELSRRMWELTGAKTAASPRSETPVRVIRPAWLQRPPP
jgi:hypothetical protein